MDYAVHNRADVMLTLGNQQIFFTTAIDRDYEADELLLKMSPSLFPFRGKFFQNVSAHFKSNRSYFQRLHQAIDLAPTAVLLKLLPTQKSFAPLPSQQVNHINLTARRFHLDTEYQIQALRQMLSCNPAAPYLLLGPFGTGKTYVLAAAVEKLLGDRSNRMLVCTHLNRGADNLYGSLQKRLGNRKACNLVLRLVANREALESLRINGSCIAANEPFLTMEHILQWPAIITTFITAIQLREMETRNGTYFPFTHILIDEGAQSPEPETLGALMLAKEQTKVVVVGDNQQASLEYLLELCPLTIINSCQYSRYHFKENIILYK